jgi:hypothetical protein
MGIHSKTNPLITEEVKNNNYQLLQAIPIHLGNKKALLILFVFVAMENSQ